MLSGTVWGFNLKDGPKETKIFGDDNLIEAGRIKAPDFMARAEVPC